MVDITNENKLVQWPPTDNKFVCITYNSKGIDNIRYYKVLVWSLLSSTLADQPEF